MFLDRAIKCKWLVNLSNAHKPIIIIIIILDDTLVWICAASKLITNNFNVSKLRENDANILSLTWDIVASDLYWKLNIIESNTGKMNPKQVAFALIVDNSVQKLFSNPINVLQNNIKIE